MPTDLNITRGYNDWNDLLTGVINGATIYGERVKQEAYKGDAERVYKQSTQHITKLFEQAGTPDPFAQEMSGTNGVSPVDQSAAIAEGDKKRKMDALSELLNAQNQLGTNPYGQPYSNSLNTFFQSMQPEKSELRTLGNDLYRYDPNTGKTTLVQKGEDPTKAQVNTILSGEESYIQENRPDPENPGSTWGYWKRFPVQSNGTIVGYQYAKIGQKEYEDRFNEGQFKVNKGGLGRPKIGKPEVPTGQEVMTNALAGELYELRLKYDAEGDEKEKAKIDSQIAQKEKALKNLGIVDPNDIADQYGRGDLNVRKYRDNIPLIEEAYPVVIKQIGLDQHIPILKYYRLAGDDAGLQNYQNMLYDSLTSLYGQGTIAPEVIKRITGWLNDEVKKIWAMKPYSTELPE